MSPDGAALGRQATFKPTLTIGRLGSPNCRHSARVSGGVTDMRTRNFSLRAIVVGCISTMLALAIGVSPETRARPRGRERRGQGRQRRYRRRRHRRQRAGGRRLGDRRNHRSADQIRQDRRHRRSGPLSRPRSAEGELQRLGARLRPGRFAEGRDRARQDGQSDRGAGAERERPRRNIIRRSTGTRCSRFRRRASSRAPGRKGTACR